MRLPEAWPAFAIMIFAVASGQIGQAYERGAAIGRKQIIVELIMLPAFGALGSSHSRR